MPQKMKKKALKLKKTNITITPTGNVDLVIARKDAKDKWSWYTLFYSSFYKELAISSYYIDKDDNPHIIMLSYEKK